MVITFCKSAETLFKEGMVNRNFNTVSILFLLSFGLTKGDGYKVGWKADNSFPGSYWSV